MYSEHGLDKNESFVLGTNFTCYFKRNNVAARYCVRKRILRLRYQIKIWNIDYFFS